MKTRNLLLIGLLLASMVLTACQQKPGNVPADPLAAIKIITDKQKEVTSEHVDVGLTLSIQATGLKSDPNNPSASMAAGFLKNFKANLTLGGDVDIAKNNFNLTGSADIGALTALLAQGADKITFDLVKVGDKMYSRASVGGNTDWQESNASPATNTSGDAPAGNPQALAQFNEIIKKAAKAEKLADESIGGVNTYHYKVTLDAIALIDQIAALAQANASPTSTPPDPAQIQQAKDLLKDSVIELEMWVGAEDLYVRQESFHINLNIKNIPDNPGATALVDFVIKATMTNVNKPVTIVAPK
jgi:hypothetical protein